MNNSFAGRVLAGMLLFPVSVRAQDAAGKHPPLLIASYSNNAAYIVSPDDKVIWESAKMPGACQDAWLLPNNHVLLIGGAYGAPVIEVDKADKIVWQLTADDIPETGFAYSAGCLRLPNGNTVVAAYTSKYPIFEVTPAKKVVWKFQNPAVGNPTHVKLLTPAVVGRFLKGEGN